MNKDVNKRINGYLLLMVLVLAGLAVYLSNKAVEKAQITESDAMCRNAIKVLKEDGDYIKPMKINLPASAVVTSGANLRTNISSKCNDAEQYNTATKAGTPIMTNDNVKNKDLQGKGQIYIGEGAAICIDGQISFRQTKKGTPPISIYAICQKGFKIGTCTRSAGSNEVCTCVKG